MASEVEILERKLEAASWHRKELVRQGNRLCKFALLTDTHESRALAAVKDWDDYVASIRNERLVVSRERLLDERWGYNPTAATNTDRVVR